MKRQIFGFIAGIIFLLYGLAGCVTDSSSVVISPLPSATPTNTSTREAIPISTPDPTTTPTLTLPVFPGTPVPMPNEPITSDNVGRLQQLAMWGKGRIEQLAYSPDGKYLVVGTTAGVWLYDAETLEELRFINTGNFVLSLAFSTDSRQLVTDVGASTIMTWDVTTGEKLSSVKIRDGFLSSGAGSSPQSVFSENADVLAVTLDDWTVGVWDVAGSEPLQIITKIFKMGRDSIQTLAISPDGSLLATGGYSEIKVWDTRTGDLVYILPGLEKTIYSLAFSPDDEGTMLLAVEGKEGDVQLWNGRSGTRVYTIQTPSSSVGTFAFSPDGMLLAIGTADPSTDPDIPDALIIQIWNVTDKTLLQTLNADLGGQFIFSPNKRRFTSHSPKGVVRSWDSETGELFATQTGFARTPLPAFFAEDKLFVSNSLNNQIELWNLETGQIINALEGHQSLITNLVLSDDGSTMISTEKWGDTIYLWEPNTGENLGVHRAYIYRGEAKGLAVSSDGQLIAVGESARGRNPAVVYPRNGLDDNRWVYQISGENGYRDPAFSPDEQKIASFFGASTVAVSQAETGELLRTLEVGERLAEGLTFSSDNKLLAIGTQTGIVQLWDSDTGVLLDTLSNGLRNKHYVTSLAYSPDDQILAVGIYDVNLRLGALTPTIELWDVEKGVLLQALDEYQANIVHLEFSPDGELLAIASADGTMRLWGVAPE